MASNMCRGRVELSLTVFFFLGFYFLNQSVCWDTFPSSGWVQAGAYIRPRSITSENVERLQNVQPMGLSFASKTQTWIQSNESFLMAFQIHISPLLSETSSSFFSLFLSVFFWSPSPTDRTLTIFTSRNRHQIPGESVRKSLGCIEAA